jgi:hypothetical protein
MTWLSRLFVASVLVVTGIVVAAAAPPSDSLSVSSALPLLAAFAGSAIGCFVIAVALDDLAGIVLAVRQHKFDVHKLGSFLESQFGTKRAIALLGLVAAAVTTALGSALVHGGLTQTALQGIADAALAAATAGAASMLLSVLADLYSKVSQFGVPVKTS